MSKGLEALERLDKELLIEDMQQYLFLSCYDTIKKELKAFETLLELLPFYITIDNDNNYNLFIDDIAVDDLIPITKEQRDILIEYAKKE